MKTKRQIFTLLSVPAALMYSGGNTANAAEGQAPDSGTRPNILFCIADDASFHHFSNSGCNWVSTPNFDRIANDGICFGRCYTPNAKSAPSRAILLTGRYSWQLKEAGNHICNFPADIKVFTEVLSESGYDVACTGKGWGPGNPGIADGKPRRFTQLVKDMAVCGAISDRTAKRKVQDAKLRGLISVSLKDGSYYPK